VDDEKHATFCKFIFRFTRYPFILALLALGQPKKHVWIRWMLPPAIGQTGLRRIVPHW
jgi:hypothetical protein